MTSVSDAIGPIFPASRLEQAVIDTAALWSLTYLRETERQNGIPPATLPDIHSWTTENRFYKKPDAQTPAGIVISDGLAARPEKGGDGVYRAWWRIGVAVIVTARDQKASNELAKLYGAAVRTMLIQKGTLGGVAERVEFDMEAYTDVPVDYLPVGAVATIAFEFLVPDISTATPGPPEPTFDESDYGEVETVTVLEQTRSPA